MIRKTQTTKYNYGRPEPLPKPYDTSTVMEKVKWLPLSGPGVPVIVPLALLPEYLQLHGLEPIETKLPANQPLVLRVVRHKKEVSKEMSAHAVEF
ncbi:MAG: hypothetical protein L0287_10090 [Anaerolineae bacterium]|nr:hypothetical protein [Anaerolineae bacterium]